MKQTIKINIKGSIFHIDEDGYNRLKEYLDKLNLHFKINEGGQDTFDDIEIRIAEIFKEKIKADKEVISLNDVNEAIKIMGEAEEIIGEENYDFSGSTYDCKKTTKKLYRDIENSKIAGICSGISAYFDIDVIWVRILFIILFLINGIGILLYIIIWIAVPPAKTAAQKLEMRGEKITLSNIEKKIKEEYENVKENLKNSKHRQSVGRFIEDFAKVIAQIAIFFAKFIIGIIGFSLVIVGFVILTGLIGAFFLNFSFAPLSFINFHDSFDINILKAFIDPSNLSLFLISLFLTIALPILSIIYGGIKLLFKLKNNDKPLGILVFILWLLSAFTLASFTFIEAKNFSSKKTVKQNYVVENISSNTLYLEMNELINLDDDIEINNEYKFKFDIHEEKVYGKPIVDIEKSKTSNFEIVLRKKSFGRDSKDAIENANDIIYSWEKDGSQIKLNNYFSLPEDERWYLPSLEIIIEVPVGKSVYLSESLEEYLEDVYNINNTWEGDMVNKKWIMTEKGLALSNYE